MTAPIVVKANLFSSLPDCLDGEVFQELITQPHVRIERIVSRGHSSPASGWYDQSDHEWVIVLQGAGSIRFEDGSEIRLEAGDYLTIPAHTKHQVCWTDPERHTVWLAVFYR